MQEVESITLSHNGRSVTLTGDQFDKPASPSFKDLEREAAALGLVQLSYKSTASQTRLFPIPQESDFKDSNSGFLPAPELGLIGKTLISRYDEKFKPLVEINIRYAWKQKGGKSKGNLVLGKVEAVSGLKSFLSDEACDYLIWLAADNCRGATEWQIEATIFHELCHFAVIDNKLTLRGHDFEGFTAEILEYGEWRKGIKDFTQAVLPAIQRSLFE